MIEKLLKGVMDKFAGSAFSTAIGGRLYAYEAPQVPIYPYCVFEQISGIQDRDFGDRLEDVLLQFTLVDSADSVATIGDAETKLFALFDDATLTITGYTSITMERTNNTLFKKGEEIDDARTFWNSINTYRLLAEVN